MPRYSYTYTYLEETHHFVPVAMETLGVFGPITGIIEFFSFVPLVVVVFELLFALVFYPDVLFACPLCCLV